LEQRPTTEPTTARTWRALGRALRQPRSFLGLLATRVQEDDVSTAAAALAYYFFLSLFPLLIFVLALASVLPIEGLEPWLLANAERSLPPDAYGLVERAVASLLAEPRGGMLSLAALLALWTSSAAFAATMNGLNRAYRVEDARSWWRARLYAIGLTLMLSLLMILAFVLTVFGTQLQSLTAELFGPAAGALAAVVRWLVTILAVVLVVAAIYYAAPAVEKDWQWIRPGSVLFVLGFSVTSAAFSFYVDRFGAYDRTYGSLGAVIVLLFWLYLLAFFLLLGGELNAMLERATGAKPRPKEDAVPIEDGRAAAHPR
jgi:membrane protein